MARGEAAKIVGVGAAATAIGGAYKFGEFLYKAKRLRDVGPSNAVYVRMIGRVRTDLDEVKRLLSVREVHDALESNPEKSKWVYGSMRDVRGALENITPHTERVGSDVEDGRRVGIRHRVYWLLSEKEKLANREKELNTAHASLLEVIGYLTGLEPVEEHGHKGHKEKKESHNTRHDTRVDIDIRRDAPNERVEREVWVEHDERAPRRVEERETWIEHEHRGPRRGEEHWVEHEQQGPRYQEREAWVDERGPRRYEERETFVERGRDPRHEAQYDDRYYDDRHGRVEERELHIERDPRDPRHVEARYTERGPDRYEEKRYEERRFRGEPLGRRPESFEDRVPDRDSWMESNARRAQNQSRYGPYGEYAEYGAPQPVGAAQYGRKFLGDPGFGDEEVLNPQPVPLNRDHDREFWVEEKEDFRYDEYGNRLPNRYLPQRLRSRM